LKGIYDLEFFARKFLKEVEQNIRYAEGAKEPAKAVVQQCKGNPKTFGGSAMLDAYTGDIPVHEEILFLPPPPGDPNWRSSAAGCTSYRVEEMRVAARTAALEIEEESLRTNFEEQISLNPNVMAASARAKVAAATPMKEVPVMRDFFTKSAKIAAPAGATTATPSSPGTASSPTALPPPPPPARGGQKPPIPVETPPVQSHLDLIRNRNLNPRNVSTPEKSKTAPPTSDGGTLGDIACQLEKIREAAKEESRDTKPEESSDSDWQRNSDISSLIPLIPECHF
jgi:hypothetical protein